MAKRRFSKQVAAIFLCEAQSFHFYFLKMQHPKGVYRKHVDPEAFIEEGRFGLSIGNLTSRTKLKTFI